MMPYMPVVRVKDVEEGIAMAKKAEHRYGHTAMIHSNDLGHDHTVRADHEHVHHGRQRLESCRPGRHGGRRNVLAYGIEPDG